MLKRKTTDEMLCLKRKLLQNVEMELQDVKEKTTQNH